MWLPTIRSTIKSPKHEEDIAIFYNVQLVCVLLFSSQRRLENAHDQWWKIPWPILLLWKKTFHGITNKSLLFKVFTFFVYSLGNKSQQWRLSSFSWATGSSELVFITWMMDLWLPLLWIEFKPSKFQSPNPSLIIYFGKTEVLYD